MRLKPADRRKQLIETALKLAEGRDYTRITRDEIAAEAGVVGSVIHHQFGTMAKLRREIMRAAVAEERLAVICQGIATGDRQALEAPAELRLRALQSLVDSSVS